MLKRNKKLCHFVCFSVFDPIFAPEFSKKVIIKNNIGYEKNH